MNETKLLPCPFCGGEGELLRTQPWWVRCSQCGGESCRNPITDKYAKTRKQAIADWNTRTPKDVQSLGEIGYDELYDFLYEYRKADDKCDFSCEDLTMKLRKRFGTKDGKGISVWCACGDKLNKDSQGFYSCLGCDTRARIEVALEEAAPREVSEEELMDIICPYWREDQPYHALEITVKQAREKVRAIRERLQK